MTTLAEQYEALMGHPPPEDTSETAWQWDWSGTKEQREKLRELIDEQAEHYEQEALF